MSRLASIALLSSLLILTCRPALATSTQFGDTGLLSQPVAQTLNEGNICVGLWANCAGGVDNPIDSSSSGVILPATITMGLGTFMEAYGSYPNILFNGDEDLSGRGYANAGFKFRLRGKRSDNFRLAMDLSGRLSVSDNPDFDGLADYIARFIASTKLDNTFGLHGNVGYALNDSPDVVDFDDQFLLGGGVEYSLSTRLRAIAELSYASEKVSGAGAATEVTAGFQYYVTPHLTMNLGASVGLSDAAPDWRLLLGLTTCQGVGTYNRPVPKLVEIEEEVEVPLEPVKVSKVRALTPLLKKIPVAESPVSHLEVPITDPDQVFIINPADRLKAPADQTLEVSPIGPVSAMRSPGESALPDQPFKAKIKRLFRFPELTFAFNQWDLSDVGRQSISLVAEELRKENKFFIISIEGHTDDVGSDAYNQTLSFKRAVAAATHLVLRDGFDPARIFVKGFGETRPIADNATDEGRSRNRRVELLILVPEGYENIRIEPQAPVKTDIPGDNSALLKGPQIDPLSIEQAIIDKTGAETATPAGTFSQTEKPRR
jgi:outer membrane protein OmpA-like peptidoglycan-associated protein